MLREEGRWVKFFTRPKRADVRREDDGERKKRFSVWDLEKKGREMRKRTQQAKPRQL
jgi:hypothetical protein